MGYGDPGWDGIYKNSELPTGDYWYVIKLKRILMTGSSLDILPYIDDEFNLQNYA